MAEIGHMQNSRNINNINRGGITNRGTDRKELRQELKSEQRSEYERGFDDGAGAFQSRESGLDYHYGWLDGLTAFDSEMFPDLLARFSPGYYAPPAPFTTETGEASVVEEEGFDDL